MQHHVVAGIYALPRATEHGLHGFKVQEKILFESARGKHLGARVERLAIEQLPAAPDDVIFGTIADGNKASRRTAYRVGRVDIGARLWLTPAGSPGMPD